MFILFSVSMVQISKPEFNYMNFIHITTMRKTKRAKKYPGKGSNLDHWFRATTLCQLSWKDVASLTSLTFMC